MTAPRSTQAPMAKKFIIKSDTPRASLINYREALNEEQRLVVGAGAGPGLVIAGAGSGKTRVVTYRVARLIEAGVAPGRIMLVTFTNRASREMLGRVESLLGQDVRRVWGGTFHSIANRVLRRHAVSLGYENNYSILDSEDAKDLIDACVDEAAIDTRAPVAWNLALGNRANIAGSGAQRGTDIRRHACSGLANLRR